MTRQRWMDVGLVALAALTVVIVVLALTQVGRSPDSEPVTEAGAATPGATRSPLPPGAPRAVFLGDSGTAGVGADGQPGWATHVATAQGWAEINRALPGTGYVTSVTGEAARAVCGQESCPSYAELLAEVAAADPDVVIVSGGREDAERSVTRPAGELFMALQQQVPDARIIVVSPLWDESPLSPDMAGTITGIRTAAQQTGVQYIDIRQPLNGRADLVAPDGNNPNPAGHRAVADAVLAGLG